MNAAIATLLLGIACWSFAQRGSATTASAARSAEPVIIDTDVGDDIDDAFALAVAICDPRLEVIGITTAWGDTRTRVLLVRRLLAAMGRQDITVAQGPATPDSVIFTQKRWALGATDQSPAPDAVDFIGAQARKRPGEITLIALAPLSNIASLLARDASAVRKLKQIAMMGGSIHSGYEFAGSIDNPQRSAEYNVAALPHALTELIDTGVPVKLFPLDSTQLKFDEVRRDRLFAFGSPTSDALTLLYHQWRLLNSWGQITPTLFDVVPVAWLLQPAVCPLVPMRILIDARGYTLPQTGAPNLSVCLTAAEGAIQKLIIDTLAPTAAIR